VLGPIVGLHHVTAIAADTQRNLDFYTQVLGLFQKHFSISQNRFGRHVSTICRERII
jgi:catechol 2,3-dioxygenase-like lactoylglutathione lyase family enzyme